MAYNNRNSSNYRRRDTRDGAPETPSTFREGQPVYRGKEGGGSAKGRYSKPDAATPAYGKPAYGEKKPYSRDAKPAYGEKKPYSRDAKPAYGEKKPAYSKDSERAVKAPPRRDPDAPNVPADELPYLVMGRNAVREALRSGRSIDKILVQKEPDGSLRELIGMARDKNLRVDEVNREKLDEMCLPFGHGGKTGNHQGIVAQVPGVEYCDISDMLADAKAKNEKPFIIVLDGIEDPHNLGSIIRSAVCAGAHGVIIPSRRSVSVTAAACKASAGAVEYAKVARVSNINGAIDRLKDEGLWIAGADMGGMPMEKGNMAGALALVIGGEGSGISRLTKEKCDFLVSIPMYGKLDSLNASVAAAVLMFEKRRQDNKKQG